MTEKRIKITPENRNKNPNQTTKSPPAPSFSKENEIFFRQCKN